MLKQAWGVVVRGNEILAGTAAFKVFAGSNGVVIRDNVYLKTDRTAKDARMFTGDCVEKCRKEGNVEVMLKVNDASPRTPTGLRAIHRHEAVELRWNRSTGKDVIGYNVYCDGRKLNPYPVAGRFHVHLDVKRGAAHVYQIAALNLADRESTKSVPLVVSRR